MRSRKQNNINHFLGGNQRDLAREKNLKKQQQANKTKGDGTATEKRMERDADVMRQKQQKAAEKAAQAQANSQQSSKVVKCDPLSLK